MQQLFAFLFLVFTSKKHISENNCVTYVIFLLICSHDIVTKSDSGVKHHQPFIICKYNVNLTVIYLFAIHTNREFGYSRNLILKTKITNNKFDNSKGKQENTKVIFKLQYKPNLPWQKLTLET